MPRFADLCACTMKREIIITKDGSHTISVPEQGITYHSHHGAVQESVHVFIEAGLRWYAGANPQAEAIRIFEMGFGTGLNAYLTALEAERKNLFIHYTAVEQHPMLFSEIEGLNYAATPQEQALFYRLHQSPWQEEVSVSPRFVLQKQPESLLSFAPQRPVHIIYFDAFAPAAQPELWTTEVFQKLYGMLCPGGVLLTYCSKGVVRRAMQAAGFVVAKIPGPPGKREIVRASRPLF